MNSLRRRPRRAGRGWVAGAAASTAAIVAVLGLGGCATAPADVAEVRLGFPSPDSGPGRPALAKAAQRHIDDGWQAIRRSDPTAARTSAAQAGASAASQLLELQAAIVGGKQPLDDLEALTRTDS